MRLPEFLCVGAAKAGTTTLHELLAQHPNLWLPDAKELHFFDNDEHWNAGTDWYAKQFSGAPDDAIPGEVTPAYMSYPTTPARISETLGNAVKLIFSLREPVARAYSEYLHNYRRGFVDCSFDEALEAEQARDGILRWEDRLTSFAGRGYYYRQLAAFADVFPASNMRVLIVEEDLGPNTAQTMNSLFEFLGVSPHEVTADRRFNEAYVPRSRSMQKALFGDFAGRNMLRKLVPSQKLRTRIRRALMSANSRAEAPQKLEHDVRRALQEQYFADDIRQLEAFLGRDLACWSMENSSNG